jgi:hypothetical protein
MLTALDLCQTTNVITDALKAPYQWPPQHSWFATQDTSSAESVTIVAPDPFLVNTALTQTHNDLVDELGQFSFKISTEQVELSFFGQVIDSPSLSFQRELEVDLGE